jgi:hypothetical protein
MNLSPFLTEVFDAYVASRQLSGERARLEAELAELQKKVAALEAELNDRVSNDEIQEFLVNAEQLLGGHASATVLTNMLVARFGEPTDKPKKRGRKKQGAEQASEGEPAAAGPTEKEVQCLISVLTRESMSVSEVAGAMSQHTGAEWLPADVAPILKVLIGAGKVATEGERRGKRYMLA